MKQGSKNYGLLKPRRGPYNKWIIEWPFALMQPGDWFTVDKRDRSWEAVRNSMFNAATTLGRTGQFRISKRASGNAKIVVTCISGKSLALVECENKQDEIARAMRFQDEQRRRMEEIKALLD